MRRCAILLMLTLFLLPSMMRGQSGYNPNMHDGTVTVNCPNTYNFYDSGGPNGDYSSSTDITQKFIAPAGQCLQVVFTSFDLESYSGSSNPWDYLEIYDGNGTGASSILLGRYYGTNSPGIIVSSSGALTFVFHSDGSVNKSGWRATVSCVVCPPPPDVITMGNGTVTTCNAIFYDPGGPNGNYRNNQNFTQTFVPSTPGMCLQVSFTSFQLQSASWQGTPNDYLTVYDGANTSAPEIGRYYGSTNPGIIISSNGALTFVFHSDGSSTYSGWKANVSCVECPNIPCISSIDGSPCSISTQAQPFCTDENPYGVTFPSGLIGNAEAFFTNSDDIGCLSTTPYPAWYYMQIQTSGSLTFQIHQTSGDVDFACWGPFSATNQDDFLEQLCCGQFTFHLSDHPNNNTFPYTSFTPNPSAHYPYGNLVDCSYSSSSDEWCHIPNAQVGQWYLVLITNYEREPGYITFSPTTNSTATTNCSLLAPFTYNSPLCEGDTLILTCTNPVNGATAYNWSGPNGWTATTTVPTVSIPNVTAANSGQYNLLPTGPGISASESHIDVTISALPNITVTANHDTVCSGTSVTLTANGAGNTASNYLWLNDNTTGLTRIHTPTTTDELGVIRVSYEVMGTVNGCSSIASYNVVVFPNPVVSITTMPENAIICKGDTAVLYASGGESYVWRQSNNSTTISEDDSVVVSPQSNTSYRVIATNEWGCTSSVSRTVSVRSLPNVFISGADQVCLGDSVKLTASLAGSNNSYDWSTGATSRIIWVHPEEDADYEVIVTNAYGCSSSATKHVDLFSADTSRYCDTICWDASFQDANFDIAGPLEAGNYNYERTYSTTASCDSLVTLQLTVLPKPYVTVYDTACSSYQWRGRTYMQSGVYQDTLMDEHGCLQVDTLYLTINQAVNVDEYLTLCGSELPYAYRDTVFDIGTPPLSTFIFNRLTPEGCDSIINLHLTVNYPSPVLLYKDTCSSYQWRGHTYTHSGIYLDSLTDENGCLRTDTLILTIYNASPASMVAQSCGEYQWNGATYTETGVYTYAHQDANGCLQVDTLYLTINHATNLSVTIDTCDSYTWYGTTYSTSGEYIYSHIDGNGCTQVDTLHLTVHHVVPSVERVIVCEPYTWHGFTHSVSGTHLYDYIDQHGCQCVDTLFLTVTTEPELVLNAVINATCNQNNGEVKIDATGGTLPYRYVYLPDSTEASFENLSVGSYHLLMIDSIGCSADAEFSIENIIHQVGLVSVTDAHCNRADGAVEIASSGGFGQFSYQWPSPIVSTTNTAENVPAGTYSVAIVDSNGCSVSLSFRVNDIPGPDACFSFSTTNEQHVTFLNCTSQDVVSWYWSLGDGQTSTEWQPTHTYGGPGEYPVVLTVEDVNQCTDSVSVMYVIREVPTIYLPSAFIPESEIAENRAFKPIGNSISEQQYIMWVYDRWGQLIFVSRHPDLGWDGRINGNLAPQGTYTYQINYQDLDGKPNSLHGSVLLIR